MTSLAHTHDDHDHDHPLVDTFPLTISQDDLSGAFSILLEQKAKNYKLPGFRPGKVPVNLVKDRFGHECAQEALRLLFQQEAEKVLKDSTQRYVGKPHYHLPDIIDGQVITTNLYAERFPDFTVPDELIIDIEKLVYTYDPADRALVLAPLYKNMPLYKEAEADAIFAASDKAIVSCKATHKNKIIKDIPEEVVAEYDPEDENEDELYSSIIGNHLVGHKLGDTVEFDHTFKTEEFRGKTIHFTVTITEHKVLDKSRPYSDDDFLLSLEEIAIAYDKDREVLYTTVNEAITKFFDHFSKIHTKRHVLDYLDKTYNFDLPPSLVKAEYNSILQSAANDKEHTQDNPDPTQLTDEQKAELHTIAIRRVKLGLLISLIAEKENITLSQESLQRALFLECMRYPEHEAVIIDHYRKNFNELIALASPFLEDQVIGFLIEKSDLKTKSAPYPDFIEKVSEVIPDLDGYHYNLLTEIMTSVMRVVEPALTQEDADGEDDLDLENAE